MALSINEEGDEEANLEIENANKPTNTSNIGLCHQPSSRAHRLRRQVRKENTAYSNQNGLAAFLSMEK